MTTTKREQMPDREMRYVVSDLKVELRAELPEQSRTITGYAAAFEQKSNPIYGWFDETIRRGAFDGADFSECIACFNHNEKDLLATIASGTLALEVDERGLKFTFDAANTTIGNDMLEHVRRGDISKCSFAFRVDKDEWVYADTTNGLDCDQRTILSFSKVWDISLVVRPAYNNTEVSVRSLLESRKKEHMQPSMTEVRSYNIRERQRFLTMKNNN